MEELLRGRGVRSALPSARKQADGRTPALRNHTCFCNDVKGRCYGFGGCEIFRNALPSLPRFTTCSTRSAALPRDHISSLSAPPHWRNGAVLREIKRRILPRRRRVRIAVAGPLQRNESAAPNRAFAAETSSGNARSSTAPAGRAGHVPVRCKQSYPKKTA